MTRTFLFALAAFAAAGPVVRAGHTPTIAFNTDPNVLRDQVLKASGDRYALPFLGGHGNTWPINGAIRDLSTDSNFTIPTRKPNHQFQVQALNGSTGAAGGWVGFDGNVPEGFVWTPTQGTTYIPPLPGKARSSVLGVSADGNAAFGTSFSGTDPRFFYWTRGGQPIDLGQAALGGNIYQQDFQPLRMRPDGVVEGRAQKFGPGGGLFDATWSPSQGLEWGKKQVDAPTPSIVTPAGGVGKYFDSGKGEGAIYFFSPAGVATPLWHYDFMQDLSVKPVALTADGKHAIVNADVDDAWSTEAPRVLALDTSVASDRPYYMEVSPQLADYLVDLGLDPAALKGNLLYEILAMTPDGSLLFGSAGTNPFMGAQYNPETYFLINLSPGRGGQSTPEPATWLVFTAAIGFAAARKRFLS